MTFEKWLYEWYDTYKKPNLQPYSLRNIEQMIRIHTPSWLKEKQLTEIRTLDIDRALSQIVNGRTRVYARQVWNSALQKACRLELIPRNPVDLSEKTKYRKKKSCALTVAEQVAFLKALEKSPYRTLMLFYLHTGVRRAEALQLRRQDILWKDRLIHIRGSKSVESDRFIILTVDVERILRERLAEIPPLSDFLWEYSVQTVSKAFKRLCPNHHLHDLRHTFITRCAESGVNMNVCQQLVGHSSPDMTLGVYTHVMDEFKRKEALKFTIFPKF